MTEPGGAFLHRNDPAVNRWYSRDVEAIAMSRGLTRIAPYFIDADASSQPRGGSGSETGPVGGLTVTVFHNYHLAYAITWYVLALMVAVAAGHLMHVERGLRRARADGGP